MSTGSPLLVQEIQAKMFSFCSITVVLVILNDKHPPALVVFEFIVEHCHVIHSISN